MHDVLRTMEADLAGHPVFGDAQGILGRLRTVNLLSLEAASRDRPLIRALCRELRNGRHRRAASAILADPVVLLGIRDLLEATRRGDESRLDESEELFAAVLRHLRDGTPGLPTAAGSPLRVQPRGVSHDVALWDPDASPSVFKPRFESALDHFVGGISSSGYVRLRCPCPVSAESVGRGCDLLSMLLPELAASALTHLRLVGILGADHFTSTTNIEIASTVFLSMAHLRNPWVAAETLLHEALHCKLGDLARTRRIWRKDDGSCVSPVIRPVWRQSQPGAGAEWPPSQAFGAFHVYVHLALFFTRVEHLEALPVGGFGTPPASFREGFRTALDRAGWLDRALDDAGLPLGSDGRSMFAWLSRTLQRLSDSARRSISPEVPLTLGSGSKITD